jgi:hypothetical protein
MLSAGQSKDRGTSPLYKTRRIITLIVNIGQRSALAEGLVLSLLPGRMRCVPKPHSEESCLDWNAGGGEVASRGRLHKREAAAGVIGAKLANRCVTTHITDYSCSDSLAHSARGV